MKWLRGGLAVLVAVLLPVCAAAQAASPAKPAKPAKTAEKLLTAFGNVTAVSADSITVDESGCFTCNSTGKPSGVTFAISPKTKIKRGGRAIAQEKGKKPPVVTDFVRLSQLVGVTYREVGGTKQAVTVSVDGFPGE